MRDELEDGVVEHGLAVRLVAGPDAGSDLGVVAYTVGLSATGHAELVCDGLPPESAHVLLDRLGHRVLEHGVALEHGQHLDAGPGDVAMPVAVVTAWDVDDLGAVDRSDGDVRALQIVWTDSTGRFPWHDGYANPSTVQPLRGPVPVELLTIPCPDVPPAAAAADLDEPVLTTHAVLHGAPVTAVWHDAGGGWQLLDGDVTDESDPKLAHRRHLLDRDPSLAGAMAIPAGSRATRGGPGEDWVHWPLGTG